MDYSIFIKQLGYGLDRKILAFDYSEALSGCLIYLVTPQGCTLLIPDALIEHRCEDVLSLLRTRIKTDEAVAAEEALAEVDGELVFVSARSEATSCDVVCDDPQYGQCG